LEKYLGTSLLATIKYRISAVNLLRKPEHFQFKTFHLMNINSRLYARFILSRWLRIWIVPEPNSLPMMGQLLNQCPKLSLTTSK